MRSNSSVTTTLLALCVCAMSSWSIRAQEVQPAVVESPAVPQRTGIPVIPHVLRPTHWFHADPNDPARSTGIGKPLKGTSWRNRPFHIGWMFGGLVGDTLVEGEIDQESGLFGGYQLGWDFDHYWGTELRYAFSKPELTDPQGLTLLPSGTDKFWDLNLLYYPWGDAEWRPFASVGIGAASFRVDGATQPLVDETLFTMPLGVGVKYMYRPWLALRTSLVDNLSFGSQGLETMHNLSLSFGVEVHFGGPRSTYFPYHGGGMIW